MSWDSPTEASMNELGNKFWGLPTDIRMNLEADPSPVKPWGTRSPGQHPVRDAESEPLSFAGCLFSIALLGDNLLHSNRQWSQWEKTRLKSESVWISNMSESMSPATPIDFKSFLPLQEVEWHTLGDGDCLEQWFSENTRRPLLRCTYLNIQDINTSKHSPRGFRDVSFPWFLRITMLCKVRIKILAQTRTILTKQR